jgi:hypothetical protein
MTDLPGLGPVSEPVEKSVLFCVLVACQFRSGFSLDRHLGSSLRSFRRFISSRPRMSLLESDLDTHTTFSSMKTFSSTKTFSSMKSSCAAP